MSEAKLIPIGKLVPNEPVGSRQGECHVNRGVKRHTWELLTFQIYSEQDTAAGEALRQARLSARHTYGTGGKLLGLRPSELSSLEHGRVRFENSETTKAMLERYREFPGSETSPRRE
jgi:hypothetical protein